MTPTDMPTDSTPPAPDAGTPASADAGQGYEITICVYPDGSFGIKKEPLDEDDQAPADGQAPASPEAKEDTVPSIEQALKAVLHIYQGNPVSGDAEKNFSAGFGSPKARY